MSASHLLRVPLRSQGMADIIIRLLVDEILGR